MDATLAWEGPPQLVGLYEGKHRAPVITETQEGAFDPRDYSRAVFYSNPASNRAKETPPILRAIREDEAWGQLAIEERQTSPSLQANVESLQQVVTPDTIVVVRGGDGSVGGMFEAMRLLGLSNPVIVLDGGRKNDKARQVLTRYARRHPEELLSRRDLQIRKVRPILATIALKNGSEITTGAYGYISQGITSDVAAAVNDKGYKRHWIHEIPFGTEIAEAFFTIRAVVRARKFSLGENGQAPRPHLDIIAANGRSMAGVLRPNVDLFKPEFRLIQTHSLPGAIMRIIGLTLGLKVGRPVGAEESVELSTASTQPMVIQLNGETVIGWLRSLRVGQDGVNVVTNRAPKQD